MAYMAEREAREIQGKYDGIILDIDGTIWNTTGIVAVAWNRAIDICKAPVRKLVAEDLQREFGKPMDAIAESLWPMLSPAEREVLLANCESEEQIAIRECSVDITYPGVVETIRELASRNNFFVVSNCQDGYIELMLEKTGLVDCVKDFECFGRTGKGKAENIMMLVQRNQLAAPVYVGDTAGDRDACLQTGVPFVWAAYGFGHQVDAGGGCAGVIAEFTDLFRMI